jgi:hypothetical protein
MTKLGMVSDTGSGYAVRRLKRGGVGLARDWAAEGWNPWRHDAARFYETDPDGFFLSPPLWFRRLFASKPSAPAHRPARWGGLGACLLAWAAALLLCAGMVALTVVLTAPRAVILALQAAARQRHRHPKSVGVGAAGWQPGKGPGPAPAPALTRS